MMNKLILIKQSSFSKRLLCALTAFFFLGTSIFPNASIAQSLPSTILNLPIPGSVVAPTAGFTPAIIKGVNLYPDNPLKFDFIIDKGDAAFTDEEFKKESTRLIKYFLSSLTVPEDEMWVNLSPYEKNRIVPQDFGKTEMGRDLLAQDYMLKQLTASLMNPDDKLGGEFWQRVYAKAQEKYGTTDIPMNTFNKIWIVPEKAVVYEHEKGAFVVNSHLKVMLEEDYLALEANKNSTKHGLGDVRTDDLKVVSGVQSAIIKDLLIPEIEKEVNQGQTFANLRQIYNAVILASWYKQALKESLLGQVYVDQKKTKGVETEDKTINEQIYNQYVESFKKGVYNYIKEDYNPETQEVVNRKYFSGGVELDMASLATETTFNQNDIATKVPTQVTVDMAVLSDTKPRVADPTFIGGEAEIIEMIEELKEERWSGTDVVQSIANKFKINLDWVKAGIEYEIVPVRGNYIAMLRKQFNLNTLKSVKDMLAKGKSYSLKGEGAKLKLYELYDGTGTKWGIHELGHLIFLTNPGLWKGMLSALVTYLNSVDRGSSEYLPFWFDPGYDSGLAKITMDDLIQANQDLDAFLDNQNNIDKSAAILINLSDEFALMLGDEAGFHVDPPLKPITEYFEFFEKMNIMSKANSPARNGTSDRAMTAVTIEQVNYSINKIKEVFTKGTDNGFVQILQLLIRDHSQETFNLILKELKEMHRNQQLKQGIYAEMEFEDVIVRLLSTIEEFDISKRNITYLMNAPDSKEIIKRFGAELKAHLTNNIFHGVNIKNDIFFDNQLLPIVIKAFVSQMEYKDFQLDGIQEIDSEGFLNFYLLLSLIDPNIYPDTILDPRKNQHIIPKEAKWTYAMNVFEEAFISKFDNNKVGKEEYLKMLIRLKEYHTWIPEGTLLPWEFTLPQQLFEINRSNLIITKKFYGFRHPHVENEGALLAGTGAKKLNPVAIKQRKDFFIEQMDARIVLAKRAISAATADAATLSVDNDTKGGIDLNPTILSTEIKRNGRGVIIPAFKGAGPDLDGMKGFVPNIINVTPITNLQLLLGLDIKSNENPQDPKNEKPVDVSFNLSALPVKEREEVFL